VRIGLALIQLTRSSLRSTILSSPAAERGDWKRHIDKRTKKIPHPLSGEAEERVAQRSVGGVSRLYAMLYRRFNSPGHRYARPPSLRLRRKEGAWKRKWMKDKRQKKILPHPLSGEAEERVRQRRRGESLT